MKYSETNTIEAGMQFTTTSGLIVETTGSSLEIETNGIFVHEVKIIEGDNEGNTFLHNLDMAEKV